MERPCQALVADITYLKVNHRFCYLFLLTDAFSRYIVGWKLARSLGNEHAVDVLNMSVENDTRLLGAIHHSDRGNQYCCHEFLNALRRQGLVSSMTDADHCAQNALAERVNGILKDEYYLDLTFFSFKQAQSAVAEAISTYNHLRPHRSLKLRKPAEVHYQLAA